MVIFRFIALVMLAVALMILGADIITTLESNGNLSLHNVGELWALFHSGSFESFSSGTSSVPGGIMNTFLQAPGFAVFGVLGLILAFLFRRRDSI